MVYNLLFSLFLKKYYFILKSSAHFLILKKDKLVHAIFHFGKRVSNKAELTRIQILTASGFEICFFSYPLVENIIFY